MKMPLSLTVGCALWLVACGSSTSEPVHGYLHGVAIINSDYKSTALTLLDPNDNTIVDPCLTSGSATPRLSQALSGDVVLPSQSDTTGEVVLIDRGNNALAWVDPNTCGVSRQLAVAPGFSGNPHDYMYLSPHKAYVTLYSPSSDGSAGNGVLIIDPQTPALTGNIIVSTLATQDNSGNATLARPDRLVMGNGMVYLTLGNVDATYKNYGAGRVLILDPNTDQIAGHLDLINGKDCSGMATSGNTLVVGCDGDPTLNPIEDSALFIYDISNPRGPVLSQTIAANDLKVQNIYSDSVAAAGGHVYFAAINSSSAALYEDTTVLMSASTPYELGGVLLHGSDVYATDASTSAPAVVLLRSGAAAQRITSAPKSNLPPRALLAF